jgi:hypothetical protein
MRQPEFYPYALSIWHVLQNDVPQRQLALTTIEKLPTKLDIGGGVARLEWAKKKADQLAQYRNLIIHTPMQFRFPWDGTKRAAVPIPSIGGTSTKRANIHRLRLIKKYPLLESVA